MRLVTFYTESHEEMFREFVEPRLGEFDDPVVGIAPQRCPSASFKQPGWNECMADKITTLMGLPADGQPTLYVDCDVAMAPGVRDWAEGYVKEYHLPDDAVAYSDDVVQWCAGVMLFTATEKVRSWWRLISDLTPIWNIPDQDIINTLRTHAGSSNGTLPVPMGVLPRHCVSNWATTGNQTVWSGEPFKVPESCVIWHANWTVGVESKMAMLREARRQLSP